VSAVWPISLSCEVLAVSVNGYFEHQRRRVAARPSKPATGRLSDEAVQAHIRVVHVEVGQEYGWPRMAKELVARGHRVGKERVRCLMQRRLPTRVCSSEWLCLIGTCCRLVLEHFKARKGNAGLQYLGGRPLLL
jgi:hypothetical protein